MVEACSRSVLEGRCALAGSEREDEQAAAVAIVTWAGPDQLEARIEVGKRKAVRAEWLTRSVAFRPEDQRIERWRAVGLSIATLVGETLHLAPAPPPPVEDEKPEPPPPPIASPPRTEAPIAETPRPQPRAWIDLGGLLGQGLDTGSWRRGGTLRGGWIVGPRPLFVTGSARYEATPSDASRVSLVWWSGSLGAGALFVFARDIVWLDVRGEVVARFLQASVDTPGATDSASRAVLGARTSIDLAWMPTSFLGVVGTTEAMWANGTVVQLRGAPIGRESPLGFAFGIAARAVFR